MSQLPAYAESERCYAQGGLCYWPQYNWLVSNKAILTGHLVYIIVMIVLYAAMKNRQAFELKGLMKLYNVIQVGTALSMTIGLAPYLQYGFFNFSEKWDSTIEFWVLVHHLSKYIDMFDTVWIIIRKKNDQFNLLHVYHHLTIGVIWGLLLNHGIGNGCAFFGAWINSFVHVIMYFHYLWTSFGLKNPWKNYLTYFQMFQFALCIFQAVSGVVGAYQTPSWVVFPQPWPLLQAAYHPTLLILFYRFLQDSKRRQREAKKKKAAE